jgi:hypothetical protein
MNLGRSTLKISLHVYFPGRCVAQVSVVATAQIQELRRLPHSDSVTFVCNGVHLLDNQTFGFYDLRPKDIIVALPCTPDNRDVPKWIALTHDSDAFGERIACIINQDISREAGRLRDFQLTKMERRPRTFRKLVANAGRKSPPPGRILETTVIAPQPDSPSRDPLPVGWAPARGQLIVGSPALLVKDEQMVGIRCGESIR